MPLPRRFIPQEDAADAAAVAPTTAATAAAATRVAEAAVIDSGCVGPGEKGCFFTLFHTET